MLFFLLPIIYFGISESASNFTIVVGFQRVNFFMDRSFVNNFDKVIRPESIRKTLEATDQD
jgi:hypothetical protein